MRKDQNPVDAGDNESVTPDGVVATTVVAGMRKRAARGKNYVVDLRIHSPVSLGYMAIEGIDTAPALVRLAKVKGLDVIAVTDYFSGEFVDRVASAARSSNITVIPGAVIRCTLGSCDDVVLTCLFPENFQSAEVRRFLAALDVPESARGNRSYLVTAPFERVLSAVEDHGGLALPSRMDKTPHRLAVVPTLVDTFGFRAFDLAYPDSVRFFKARWPKTKFQLFSFSNANALAQVGSRIARVKMTAPGFGGLRDILARS